MDIIKQLNWRYAVKEFNSNRELSVGIEDALKDSIILSPSAFGLQPYRVLWVKDPLLREELVQYSWGQKKVEQSNLLIVFCSELNIDDNYIDNYINRISEVRSVSVTDLSVFSRSMKSHFSKMDDRQKHEWAARQTYIALGNLLTVCAGLYIDACPMEGFLNDKYDEILGLKEKGLHSEVIVAIGFRSANDLTQFQQKVRRKKEDLFIDM